MFCMALALGKLHDNFVIYRDLKPENILLDKEGYPILTDFGLSKKLLLELKKTTSICGTPEYFAPEFMTEEGYDFSIDWWALGILTYELIVGFTTFYSGKNDSNYQKMYQRIKEGEIIFPDPERHKIQMSEDCKDFIRRCLEKDASKRLGSTGDMSEILRHKWFSNLDLNEIQERKYVPDFKP